MAEALEDLCGGRPGARVGELARHWFNATQPADLARTISYSRQAGDAALSALAPADAVHYYAQALNLYPQVDDPDPVLALDLAIGLGTAQRQIGDPVFRETLLDATRQAADLGDTERLVAAALANSRGFLTALGTVDADKVEVLEMALDRLSADHRDRALVIATLCAELTYRGALERRQALAEEAVGIAYSSGDDAVIVRVLNHLFMPLCLPPLMEQWLARSADALVRAERLGDPVLLFFAAVWRATAVQIAGDLEECDRCLEIQRSLAEQLDQPLLSWVFTLMRVPRARIAGDTDLAEALANEALQIGTDCGQPDAASFWGTQLVSINRQRGTLGELIPVIEELVRDLPDITRTYTAVLALAYSEADRNEEARQLLEEFATVAFDLPMDASWLSGMVCYASAAIAVGDSEYARPLFDRLVPWAELYTASTITAAGPVSHFLGGLATVLGRYDDADSYFAQSDAITDRMGDKFFASRTNLWWGKMLAERHAPGDTEKARDLLTKAHTVAAANGYANVERRAAEALELLNH